MFVTHFSNEEFKMAPPAVRPLCCSHLQDRLDVPVSGSRRAQNPQTCEWSETMAYYDIERFRSESVRISPEKQVRCGFDLL